MLKGRFVQLLMNHVTCDRKKVARLDIWTVHLHLGWQRFWKDLASGEIAAVQVQCIRNDTYKGFTWGS